MNEIGKMDGNKLSVCARRGEARTKFLLLFYAHKNHATDKHK